MQIETSNGCRHATSGFHKEHATEIWTGERIERDTGEEGEAVDADENDQTEDKRHIHTTDPYLQIPTQKAETIDSLTDKTHLHQQTKNPNRQETHR